MKIAVMAPKGGVGKTTTTFCLAACLSRLGCSVLSIDLDPQGDLSDAIGFGVDRSSPTVGQILNAAKREQPALLQQSIVQIDNWTDLITPGSDLEAAEQDIAKGIAPEFRLQDALSKQQEYDFVLIDTPKGDGLLSKNALIACDAVLVPFQTEPFALKNFSVLLEKITEVGDRLNPNLYICAIIPSQVKRNRISSQVLGELKKWESQDYSFTREDNVWVAPPVHSLTLYVELSALKVSLYDHPDQEYGKHIYPFEQVAKELIRQRSEIQKDSQIWQARKTLA